MILKQIHINMVQTYGSRARRTAPSCLPTKNTFLIALALVVSSAVSSYGATVNCTGSGDVAALQSAVNAGGTVTIAGTCSIGSSVNINTPVAITGNATLNGGGGSSIFAVGVDGVSISGLTFNGATAVQVFGTQRSNFTFTHNTVQNTNGNDGLDFGPIMHYATISYNTFFYIAPNGFSSYVFNGSCYASNSCTIAGTAIGGLAGWDNSTIENNTFDMCAEGIHISWDLVSQDQYYVPTANVSVSYNTFTRIHRIALEVQGTTTYTPCTAGTNVPANCTDLSHIYSDNFKVAGNFAHDFFQPYIDTFGFSLPHANNAQHINNSVILNSPTSTNGQTASAFEISGANVLNQGNVLAADYFAPYTPHGWGSNIVYGGQLGGAVFTSQNNVLCTDQELTTDFEFEGGATPTVLDQFNFRANTCPNAGHLITSNIGLTSGTSSTSGSNQIFNFAVVSALSIKNVQFFLDGSTSPVATQELQDLNNNFAADMKWLYHATVDTTNLSGGNHTIVATATDVSGATKSLSQSFTVGGTNVPPTLPTVLLPTVLLSGNSIAFGSQTVGVASASQALSLTNSGTAPLTISGISLNGSNAVDFKPTTNCVTTLAPGASCSMSAVLTASVAGSESATFSIADNAAGSPQTVSLSGTGTVMSTVIPTSPIVTQLAAATSSNALPSNLPTGMIMWLANNVGVVLAGNGVCAWQDQSGNGADAIQDVSTNQPALVPIANGQSAVQFDGSTSFLTISSLPISGLTGMSVFIVSAAINETSFEGYGISSLLYWPETAAWGTTYFGSYQTSSHFRFGTTQTNNEEYVPFRANVSDSLGLSEFVHSGTTDRMYFNANGIGWFPNKLSKISGTGATALLGQGTASSFFVGQVSEVIVYKRALNDAERQSVENYLLGKYSLAVNTWP